MAIAHNFAASSARILLIAAHCSAAGGAKILGGVVERNLHLAASGVWASSHHPVAVNMRALSDGDIGVLTHGNTR